MKMSRRGFMHGAAAAGTALAFPSIIPARVLGADAPSNTLNVAQIGCGRIGRTMDAPGFMRGPERTLLDREGSDADQALLLHALLEECGVQSKILYAPPMPAGETGAPAFAVPMVSHAGRFDYTAASWLGLSEEQISQLERYNELLCEWNEKINLTAITDPKGVAVKHFADSLSIFNYIDVPQNARVIDVGTGAGFPGLVLKIARPDIQLTLLDSLQKRLNFLNVVCGELNLDAVLIHSRAEEGGQNLDLREGFDLVVSRAVAQLNILSEYCLPYARLSGRFVAFKGTAEGEINSAKKAIGILGGKIRNIYEFELPFEGGGRTLVEIEKVSPTPEKYPRQNGKIKSKPL